MSEDANGARTVSKTVEEGPTPSTHAILCMEMPRIPDEVWEYW